MEKEVRIKLRSVRYEVEASVFSEVAEDGLLPLSEEEAVEPEIIEINTLGSWKEAESRVEISYEETQATGMEGSSTAVSFFTREPGVISMIREGAVSTVLVFEEGKRHHCVYHTPFMPFEVCVHTKRVENRLQEKGSLVLDYMIEIRGARAERTQFSMEVL